MQEAAKNNLIIEDLYEDEMVVLSASPASAAAQKKHPAG